VIDTQDMAHDEFVSSFPVCAAHAATDVGHEAEGIIRGAAYGLIAWAIVALIAAVY